MLAVIRDGDGVVVDGGELGRWPLSGFETFHQYRLIQEIDVLCDGVSWHDDVLGLEGE